VAEFSWKSLDFDPWISPSMHVGQQAMSEEVRTRTPRKLASQQWAGSTSSDITHKNTSIMRSLRTCGYGCGCASVRVCRCLVLFINDS